MPKPVDDMVDKMLADKSFYPKKTKEAREATAWAIAYSKYNKRKKKSYWIIDGKLIKTALDVKIYQAKLADDLGNFKKADSIDNLIRFAYQEDNEEDEDWYAQSGEYWIDDYGNAHYADSDVGDVGHEDLAEQEIIGRLGFDPWEAHAGGHPDYHVVNKYTAETMTKKDLLGLLESPGTKEAPTKDPKTVPDKPERKTPYQPKHQPKPKARLPKGLSFDELNITFKDEKKD